LRYRRNETAATLRREFRELYRVPPKQRVLLMVGSDYKRKGMDRGLRAIASLPPALRENCRVLVVGTAKEKPLRRLSGRLGLDADLTLIGASDEVPQIMLAADLLMHPARSESAGGVIVEALAAGLPVLCTAVCGYADHVLRSNGGLVISEPFRQEHMNQQLLEMLNTDKLQAWQQNALAYAASEDLYSRTERIVEAIEKLAGGKKDAR